MYIVRTSLEHIYIYVSLSLSLALYIYVCIHIYTYIYIYMHTMQNIFVTTSGALQRPHLQTRCLLRHGYAQSYFFRRRGRRRRNIGLLRGTNDTKRVAASTWTCDHRYLFELFDSVCDDSAVYIRPLDTNGTRGCIKGRFRYFCCKLALRQFIPASIHAHQHAQRSAMI